MQIGEKRRIIRKNVDTEMRLWYAKSVGAVFHRPCFFNREALGKHAISSAAPWAWEKPPSAGIRTEDILARSIPRLKLYTKLDTRKIDTTDKTVSQILGEIQERGGR